MVISKHTERRNGQRQREHRSCLSFRGFLAASCCCYCFNHKNANGLVSAFLPQSSGQYPRTTSTKTATEISTATTGVFSSGFRDEFKQLLKFRRDVRRFDKDLPVSEELLADILPVAFNTAPSVGLSEPWRIVRVESQAARERVLQNFIRCNQAALEGYSEEQVETNQHEPPMGGDNAGSVAAATTPKHKSKKDLYASLKLSGMCEAPVQLAIFCDEGTSKGSGLGSQTMPEMKRYSVVCAIQSFWLLARSVGLGVGWVSILDPKQLIADLHLDRDDSSAVGGEVHDESPAHAWTLVGYLCVGYPDEKELDGSRPELERFGWEERRGKGLPPTINSTRSGDLDDIGQDDRFHFYRDLPIKVV